MKKILSVMALVCSLILVAPIIFPQTAVEVEAASKTELGYMPEAIAVNETAKISLYNKKSKAKYTYTSNKKSVATVSSKGVVTGKAAGTAKITVNQKLNGKTTKVGVYTIKVKKAKISEYISEEGLWWFSAQPGYCKDDPVKITPDVCLEYINSKAKYSFYSNNSDLVISKTGKVTDVKKSGKAKLTVKETYKGKTRTVGSFPVELKDPTYTGEKDMTLYVGDAIYLNEYLEGVGRYWFTMSDEKRSEDEILQEAGGEESLGGDVLKMIIGEDGNWDSTLEAVAAGTRYCYITQYNYITKTYDKVFAEFVINVPDTSKMTEMQLPWEKADYSGSFDKAKNTLTFGYSSDPYEDENYYEFTVDFKPAHYSGKIEVISSDPSVVTGEISEWFEDSVVIWLEAKKVGKSTITIKAGDMEKSFEMNVYDYDEDDYDDEW